MRCTRWHWMAWLVAWTAVDCGGGGESRTVTDAIAEWHDPGPARPDVSVVAPDYAEVVDQDSGFVGELPVDQGEPPDSRSDLVPGQPGAPCKKNADCETGFCIETPQGRECAAYCYAGEDTCPPGYRCSQVQAYPDTIYVCVYLYPRLCRPCERNQDCEAAFAPGPALCVPRDPAGRFCGSPCSETSDCPPAYDCREVTSLSGILVRQCVPVNGECTCSKTAVAEGASTPCLVENEHGRCPGLRTCTQTGLSPCLAPEPVPEECNGVDDDCNGLTDDGKSVPCVIQNAFGECPGWTVCQGGQVQCTGTPATQEACNGRDDDCDGETDEAPALGCVTYYRDGDEDTWGATSDFGCLCAPTTPYSASRGGDCDDSKPGVNPGATEVCNGGDDDCDGQTDEEGASGCSWFIRDADGDGWGAGTGADRKCLCAGLSPYTATKSGDCDDSKPAVNPWAKEACNGLDDDCDGATDVEGSPGCILYFLDKDGDQYGDDETEPRCLCQPDKGQKYTALQAGDCDDANAAIRPTATEVCDTKDNDCDGDTDEPGAVGCVVRYRDEDGDGYGIGSPVCTCTAVPPVTAIQPGDCHDADAAVSPGATEVCNGLDDDCDNLTDEENALECREFYLDEDGDGWGTPLKKCLCAAQGTFRALVPGDCNDANATQNPGALEMCGNGLDDNCSGTMDEENGVGCDQYYYDLDDDGFGISLMKCLCEASGFYRALVAGDCDDTKKGVHPAAMESCNGLDDDCDGTTDEEGAAGCGSRYVDGDGDGFGVMSPAPRCLCGPDVPGNYTALVAGDCDDGRAGVYPGAAESCNALDDDCDGTTDEEGALGCAAWYKDQDLDGYGSEEWRCLCGPDPAGKYTATGSGDCDDLDAAIHPGARICGKDADCDKSPLDVGEACDDGNAIAWDGCTNCQVTEARINFLTTGDQGMPAVAALPSGGWVVAYQMYFSSPTTRRFDVGVRLVSNAGLPLGSSDTVVNTTAAGDQVTPSIAAFAGGRFVVAWQSDSQDGDSWGIWSRVFNAAGSPEGGEVPVNTHTTGAQIHPRVVALATGDFVVVWQSYAQDGDGNGVYGRRLSSSGGPHGSEFRVNATTAGDQSNPSLARLSNDRLLVVWESPGTTPGMTDIRWRILGAEGNPLTPEGTANSGGTCTRPDVAVLKDDRFLIAWERDDAGNTDVYARRFASDGSPDGLEFRLHQHALDAQLRPRIAALPDGRFVAVWMSQEQDGSYFGIFTRRYDAAGNALGAEFQANVFTTGEQSFPVVSLRSDATSFVVWQSLGQDGNGYGVFGRPFAWP